MPTVFDLWLEHSLHTAVILVAECLVEFRSLVERSVVGDDERWVSDGWYFCTGVCAIRKVRMPGILDTKVGTANKDDPADVAEVGFLAMMNGDGDVVGGWQNKLQAAIAKVTPADILAEAHRKMAAPGTAI